MWRAGSRDRRETGSGLGLAIVRELVTAMRGQVRASAAAAEDVTMAGACLSVFLPFAGRPQPGQFRRAGVSSATTEPTTTPEEPTS